MFKDETTDLTPANAAANAYPLHFAGLFRCGRNALLTGRTFTWSDDKNAPRVAIVNREFARRLFGSVESHGQILQVMGRSPRASGRSGRRRKVHESARNMSQPAMFPADIANAVKFGFPGGAHGGKTRAARRP